MNEIKNTQFYIMQPQNPQQFLKTVLRNLQKRQPHHYLISKTSKTQLNYPQSCLYDPQDPTKLSQLVSIDCQMLLTEKGNQLCRVVIIDSKFKVLYNQWFLTQYPVVDYLTHITGITKNVMQTNAMKQYEENQKNQILKLLKNKIVVGHDLANDLQVLNLQHHAFIDTVHICPHNFGLPHKNKLKDLSMEMLRKPIQWGHHNPIEDANAALEIVYKVLQQGRGTVEEVPMKEKKPQDYKNIWQIIEDAQLQKDKIVGLFLRGSRALDLEMNIQGYKSDWDYFCVYDTWATIHGRLIKLPQIDITIYDVNTFNHYIHNQNDIPQLQLFFLPQQHQIINKLKYPKIEMQKLRESLGFHLMKSNMKIKRFRKDPTKKWKILKSIHMKMRFMDYFLQIFQHGKIIDVKRMNSIWEEFKQEYLQSQNFDKTYKKCQTWANQYMEIVRQHYQSKRKVNGLKNEMLVIKSKINLNKASTHMQQKQSFKATNVEDSSSIYLKSNPLHQKLLTVRQLRQNGFENMDKYKITIRRGVKHPNLVQLKYLQSALFKNPICNQTRGMIVDEDRGFGVVALPYFKFFDYNDTKYSQLSEFDFRKYRVYQKFDGSIAFIYHYKEEWHVASSSVPDAETDYCFARKQTTIEFRKQFWRVFYQLNYKLPDSKDRSKTFVFQLMSKNHIIVVNRDKDSLVLHGVRNIDTLKEESSLEIYQQKYKWNIAQPIQLNLKNPLDPISQIVEITQKLDPLKQQGFILCDHNFIRMKVKSSNYLRINWLGELNLTQNKDPSKYILINIVLAGEAQVFGQYCPEWQPIIKEFCSKIQKLNSYVLQQYEALKDLEQKQFALEVKNSHQKIQSFLFMLRSNYDYYKGRLETTMLPKKFYAFISEFQFDNL